MNSDPQVNQLVQQLSILTKNTPNAAPFLESVATVANAKRVPQAAADLALDFLAICQQESGFGVYLSPKGPQGTGDWTARVGHWLNNPAIQVVDKLPEGWFYPRKNGAVLPGPYAIPKDGLGFGRGAYQIDACSNWDWCQELMPDGVTFKWQDPYENLLKCCDIYLNCQRAFPTNKKAAFAAYNCGITNAQKGIDEFNDSDHYTTHRSADDKGYGECVLEHKARWHY